MASSDFKASEAQPDLEKQPLLLDKNQGQKTFGSVESGSQHAPEGEDHNEGVAHDEWDSTQYDISLMTTWESFAMMKGAVFANPTVWRCMLFATILACCAAVGTCLSGNVKGINPAKVQKLATFLNVFVGMLVGFFLSSSMNRWYGCINAFLQLLDAVRSMQMQMIALGVDRERCETLSRYGVLSAWLLHLSVNNKKPASESSPLENAWALLEQVRPHIVDPQEKEWLLPYQESYALLLKWVAS
jgi:hypothetical protein